MRRSKVQRQEARRERKLKLRRPAKKEDKDAPERFTVVLREDCRRPKYLWADLSDGFDRAHAEELAAPVEGQRDRYTIVPVEVYRFARSLGEPISPEKATVKYRSEQAQ